MYAVIVDDNTKLCNVGVGTNIAFYKKLGMMEMEVEQATDGKWYVKGYAPTVVPTVEEQIEAIDAQYKADKEELIEYFVEFLIEENTEGQQAIRDEMALLDSQYDADITALNEGGM